MADSSFFTDGGSGSGTFQTIETKIAEAEAAKVAAEAAQAAAEQAETDAQTAEAGSVAAKNTAVASSSNAAISESNAASSSANASNKASDSQKLAINPEDSLYTLSDGSTTGYSALHYDAKAADSLVSATTQASNAAASAVTAGQHKDDAESAKTAAESARDSALSALDNFEDNYLGDHSSDPTTDGDGDPLTAGSIYFNTTDSVVKVYTGSAWVVAYADGATLVAKAGDTMTGNLSFGDNNKAIFGAGSDLQIYHDGSNSYIWDAGTGLLQLRTNGSRIEMVGQNGSEYMARFEQDGAVKLYYDNAQRLATTSTGVGITGQLETSGDVTVARVDGQLKILNGTSSNEMQLVVTGSTGSGNAALRVSGGSQQYVLINTSGIDVTGNITVSGTVDGRDVATDGTKLDGIEASATADQTASEIKTAYESNADTNEFSDAEQTKLAGIEASATADQTKSDIDALGIDAATLDGIDSSSFLRSDASDTTTGNLTISKDTPKLRLYDPAGSTSRKPILEFDTDGNQGCAIELNIYDSELPEAGYGLVVRESTTNTQWPSTGDLTFSVLGEIYAGSESLSSVNKVWHAGNDGSGSGLDADTLDGVQGSSFLRSDANDTFSGELVSTARDRGVFGVYDSYKTDHIWSMGTAYKNHASGTNFGTLYGLAYKHTNNTTGGTMGGGHQMVWCTSGTPRCSLGTNIWTSGNVTAYSDIRVKTNIELIPDALDKVCQLNGYTFDRTDITHDEHGVPEVPIRQTGVIAQEVLEHLPEAVMGDEEGHYSVAYGNMVGLLIEAIKELKEEIEELKKG